jgi:lipoprotein LpqH
MQNRLVTAAALIVVAGASACAVEPTAGEQKAGRITLDGNARSAEDVSCTQVKWLLVIETTAGAASTRSTLQLEGEKPTVETVNISNFDGFNGVAGQGIGKAEAAFVDGAWTISGTAEGSVPNEPGKQRTAPFRIEAPC